MNDGVFSYNGWRKVKSVVTKEQKQRNIIDDIAEGIRQVLDDIENLLNPDKQKKQRARVPVPVRDTPPHDPRRMR